MAFSLMIKPIAYVDIDEIVAWYEKAAPGLGKRFLTNMDWALKKIQSNPNAFTYVKYPVRRIIVEKFPYKILYQVTGEVIIILGICHAKRNSAFIKRRFR